MDVLKSIKSWLKQHNEPPWPIGVGLTIASDEAKFAAEFLSLEELVAISKHNRFKKYRNEVIKKIKSECGIPLDVMAELTGLNLSTVKVLNSKKRHRK